MPEDEAEIKAAFAKAIVVRAKGAEAKELADRYFLETFVRVHRAGEGAPYTGLKDEPVILSWPWPTKHWLLDQRMI
ncbi:MAG: DUF6448 family protein [Kiritimatiellae bacterium]|nr:DUF6448 family protein [Kiritimatiellia bacterium]